MAASARAPTSRRYRGIPLALCGATQSLSGMPESTMLSPTDLERYLPHRGLNLLPDGLELHANGTSSVATVTVPVGDPRGREIFSRDDGHGGRVWLETIMAEVLALAGIAMLRERLDAAGHEGVYSAISRMVCKSLVDFRKPLIAHAHITRDRGSFTQFGGGIEQDGEIIFTGEFMSGTAPLAEVASRPVQPGSGVRGEALQADFGWKDPALTFVDDVRSWDAESGDLVCGYTYPTDHPLVPGHFPDAGLMMGVTQWQAVFDAGCEAAARLGISSGELLVNGRLERETGEEIVDVREMVIDFAHGVPALRATKRIAFREPVRPGDGMLVAVNAQRPG
jgi:3-hydroxymyristoyl/3-hydroxydecanoyl-(acyl carrier protein) dehydratase